MQTQTNAVTRKAVYTRAKFIADIKKLNPCDQGFDLLQATPGTPKQIMETYLKARETRHRYYTGRITTVPSNATDARAANLSWLEDEIHYGASASARLTAFFKSVVK